MALLGALSTFLAPEVGWWLVGLSFTSLVVWLGIAYLRTVQENELGLTSEISALLSFFCGILAATGRLELAFGVAISVTVILALKQTLHQMAERLSPEDVVATLKFLVVAFVVLPLLPSETWSVTVPGSVTPWAGIGDWQLEVINPAKVGWMVVLIAGLSFAGYASSKLMSAEKGLGVTAFLGGLVSSTAVTLSFASRAKQTPALMNTCVVAILVASTTMFFRVLVEVLTVAPALLPAVAAPVGAMGIAGLVMCAFFWFRGGKETSEEEVELSNPFELSEAFKFGAFFAVVLLIAGAARTLFGAQGLYLSGLLAGLTDVDAITLSVAQLTRAEVDPLSTSVAATTITIAAVSNTLTKGVMALTLGGRALGVRVLGSFGVVAASGGLVLLLSSAV